MKLATISSTLRRTPFSANIPGPCLKCQCYTLRSRLIVCLSLSCHCWLNLKYTGTIVSCLILRWYVEQVDLSAILFIRVSVRNIVSSLKLSYCYWNFKINWCKCFRYWDNVRRFWRMSRANILVSLNVVSGPLLR